MAEQTCNDCGAPIFDQRYLKCGACLRRVGVVALMSPLPPAINWKEAARHYRHLLKLSEEVEVTLKRRLWGEHEKRTTLVNAMSTLLPRIVDYGWCCEGIGAHAEDCPYLAALAAVAEAGRSVDGRVEPTSITFTCHHCGGYFDEPIAAFVATASVSVLAPTLCKDCGHGDDD